MQRIENRPHHLAFDYAKRPLGFSNDQCFNSALEVALSSDAYFSTAAPSRESNAASDQLIPHSLWNGHGGT